MNKIIFIFFLMFFNCSNFTSDDDMCEPIEGRINFNLNENFKEGETIKPRIGLTLETEKIYPNYNYYILNEKIIHGNTIFIDIISVCKPEVWMTMPGPATSYLQLDEFDGFYSLYLRCHDFLDIYLIEMNDTFIKIDRMESKYTKADYLKYYRRPKNSFMSKTSTPEKYYWIYDAFLDTLKNTIEIEEFKFPDDGVVGYTGHSNANQFYEKINFFYYKNKNNFDIAGLKLKQYAEGLSDSIPGIRIYLINFNNKLYYSINNNK